MAAPTVIFVFPSPTCHWEFQAADRWRSFLFEHRVPGYVDRGFMLRDAHRRRPADLLCLEWPATMTAVELAGASTPLGRMGWYSFNPEPENGTHNCVTWAFSILNQVLGEKLPPVRDGRMKVAVELLRELGATRSE